MNQPNLSFKLQLYFFVCLFVFCFCFLGLHLWHMEVPRLGVESELQLLAFATATATQDPSCICSLHHISQQCQILNPKRGLGIKPASSRILVRFVSAEPQWKLQPLLYLFWKVSAMTPIILVSLSL